jgi:phosphoglycolate phosphatase-like HAD superfamily hydrolase
MNRADNENITRIQSPVFRLIGSDLDDTLSQASEASKGSQRLFIKRVTEHTAAWLQTADEGEFYAFFHTLAATLNRRAPIGDGAVGDVPSTLCREQEESWLPLLQRYCRQATLQAFNETCWNRAEFPFRHAVLQELTRRTYDITPQQEAAGELSLALWNDFQPIIAESADYYRSHICPMPGLEALLTQMKSSGTQGYLITNSNEDHARLVMSILAETVPEITEIFDFVICQPVEPDERSLIRASREEVVIPTRLREACRQLYYAPPNHAAQGIQFVHYKGDLIKPLPVLPSLIASMTGIPREETLFLGDSCRKESCFGADDATALGAGGFVAIQPIPEEKENSSALVRADRLKARAVAPAPAVDSLIRLSEKRGELFLPGYFPRQEGALPPLRESVSRMEAGEYLRGYVHDWQEAATLLPFGKTPSSWREYREIMIEALEQQMILMATAHAKGFAGRVRSLRGEQRDMVPG